MRRYIVSIFFIFLYVFFLISPIYAMDLPEPVVLQDGTRQWIITTLFGKSKNRIFYEYIVNGESICSSTVQTGLYSDLYPRAILNNGNPILVWSGIKKNNGDSDIYYAEWESTFSDCKDSWSPTRMVHPDNTVPDMAPELTYDSEGNIRLIWQRNTGRHIEQQTAVFLDGAFEIDNAPQEILSTDSQPLALEAIAAGFYVGMPIRIFQGPLNCIAFGDSITEGLKRDSRSVIDCKCGLPSGGAEACPDCAEECSLDCAGETCSTKACLNCSEMCLGCAGACSYTDELLNFLTPEDTVSTAAIYNWGVRGERSYQGVSRIEAVMSSQSDANCILIMYGANDRYEGMQPSDTAANIQTMLTLAHEHGKVPVLASITPNTAVGGIEPYNEAIWQMAGEVGLLSVEIADQYTALNEDWGLYTSGDGLHVSDAGDQRMAEEWLRALKENPALFSIDHDGDGILTIDEDADGDGDPRNDDCDEDSTPDYLDTDPCGPFCGNGVVEAGESCDDGNTGNDDGCDSSCLVESGWSCSGSPSLCTLLPVCGNGAVEAGEQCDDGNTVTESCVYGQESCTVCAGDCSLVAGAVSYCGDAAVDSANGETCDDGGESATCDSDCSAAVCGDGTQNASAGEACDDGNTADNDGCSSTCQLEVCGDGIVQTGEECDDAGESVSCDVDCTFALCGDGVVNVLAGEECDDGNTINTDDCSKKCSQRRPIPAVIYLLLETGVR